MVTGRHVRIYDGKLTKRFYNSGWNCTCINSFGQGFSHKTCKSVQVDAPSTQTVHCVSLSLWVCVPACKYLMCEAVSHVSTQLETVGMLSLSVLSLTGLPPACGVHSDAGSYGEHHRWLLADDLGAEVCCHCHAHWAGRRRKGGWLWDSLIMSATSSVPAMQAWSTLAW